MSFNVFGVRLKISFLFVAFLSLTVLFDSDFRLLFCLISGLIHEAGHITAMIISGLKPDCVSFKPFDIVITHSGRCLCRDNASLFIILAGVLANIIFSVLFFLIGFIAGIGQFYLFASINAVTAVFNLIPASNLDGGQAVYLLLSKKLSLKTTDRIITALTLAAFFPAFVTGFLILFYSPYNFSLLILSIYLLLSVFLKENKYY